jgi:hypothetical protein
MGLQAVSGIRTGIVFETRKTRIPRSWGRDLYAGIRSSVLVYSPTNQRSEVSEQNIDAVRECIGLFFRKGPVSIWSSMNSHATGADGYIDVCGEHECASPNWHLYICSVRQVVVDNCRSPNGLLLQLLYFLLRRFQFLLQTICSLDLFVAIELVVARRLVITPGLSIELCLCLDGALVVTQRQQRSGADGGSVGILQRQNREQAASWMV